MMRRFICVCVTIQWMLTCPAAFCGDLDGGSAIDHPLRLIPSGQQMIVQFDLANVKGDALFSPSLAAFEKQFLKDLESWKMSRVAQVLGLTIENIRTVYVARQLVNSKVAASKQEKGVALSWLIRFRRPVDVSSVLRLGNPGDEDGPETEDAFMAEMINGKVVFFHKESELMVYQASPKDILIGGRNLIRKSTRLSDTPTEPDTDVLKDEFKSIAPDVYIRGALRLPGNEPDTKHVVFEATHGLAPSLVIRVQLKSDTEKMRLFKLVESGNLTSDELNNVLRGRWKVVGQSDGVKLSIPLSKQAAEKFTEMVRGDSRFIQSICQRVIPSEPKNSMESVDGN